MAHGAKDGRHEALVRPDGAQLSLVAIFFGLEKPLIALIIILGMLIVILAFIANRWQRDRIAALLFIPYAAWVAFAMVLNASIAYLN